MSTSTFWTSADYKLGLQYYSYQSHRFFPKRCLPEYAVVYALSGMRQITEGNEHVDLNPGEVFIANASIPRFSRCVPIKGSCTGFVIILRRDQMRELIAELGLGNQWALDDPVFYGKMFWQSHCPSILRAVEVFHSSLPGRASYLEAFTRQALMEVLWNWNPNQIGRYRRVELRLLSLRHFVSALDFMYQCGKRDFSVESLCDHIGMSCSNYRRLLYASAQVSPLRLYNQVLMERAKVLFSRPFVAVKEVALELGFHSPNQFSQLFRQCAGTSPSEYQERVRASEGRAECSGSYQALTQAVNYGPEGCVNLH